MGISALTIRLILLILPGAIACLIVESLTIHKPWKSFRFILYAILLGFSSYTCTQLFFYLSALKELFHSGIFAPETINFRSAIVDANVPISFREIFDTCILAIPLGLIVSWVIQHQFLQKGATLLRISDKYSDEDLYTHFLQAKEIDWVWVRDLKQELTYEGQVRYYSVDDGMRELLLEDVKVLKTVDASLIYEVSKMYLTFLPNEFRIEIPSKEENNHEQHDAC
jgi:hypothetical protein